MIKIVSEVGINANGSRAMAFDLIRMAKNAGADYVKFQKRTIDQVYAPDMLLKPRESPFGSTQGEQKKALEFSEEDYEAIDAFCEQLEIPWFASAWDHESAWQMDNFQPPFHKIASAMAQRMDFVKFIAEFNRPIIMSTGGLTLEEVDERVKLIEEINDYSITLLHCIAGYPVADEDARIQTMVTMAREFPQCDVGYSGHEVGLLPSIIAAALGAKMIERHITLDRAMYGSDQAASLEKRGLELLVKECKAAPTVLGDGYKTVTAKEREVIEKLQPYWTTQEPEKFEIDYGVYHVDGVGTTPEGE